MGAVDLHPLEPGLLSADGGGDEVVPQSFDLGQGQGPGSGFGVVGGADRGGSNEIGGGPHAGMVELHDRDAAFRLDGGGQAGQPLQVDVGEDAQLTWEPLSHRLHMGRAGHGQAKTAFGP